MKAVIHKKNSLNFILTSLILIFLVRIASSQEAHQVRMAMVGNSITFGTGLSDPANENYAAQLSDMLQGIYGDTVLIQNYGVSGRTMLRNTDKAIWDEIKFRNALEFVPDVCVILLGTNDSHPEYWDPYGDEFLDDYLTMIDTFKFRNPNTEFIVCLPPPIFEGSMYGHDSLTLVDEIIPLIESVATNTGATLVDFQSAFVDSVHLFPDKLHPNVDGAQIMAEILFDLMIDTDLVHQVETGLAFVSTFKQFPAIVPDGSDVQLQWTTIFADSVFLDGVSVDISGNTEVIAEAGKTYTLTAKGPNNVSEYPLLLNTSPVSTSEVFNNNNIKVFPNPVGGTLFFEIEDLTFNKIQVKIFNLLGEELLEQSISNLNRHSAKFELNTSNLIQGVYIYAIYIDSEMKLGKFSKDTNR